MVMGKIDMARQSEAARMIPEELARAMQGFVMFDVRV